MKNLVLVLSASALLFSCTSQRPVKQVAPHNPVDVNAPIGSNSDFFNMVLKKPSFQQVKISSKVDVQTGSYVPTLDATTYIENDQKIWMNLSALMFTIARGMATPQGIKGYEKYNKTFIDSDFNYLKKMLNVNFIDYNSLQNLLIGRIFLPISEENFTLTQNAQGYLLTSIHTQKFTSDGKTSEYHINFQYSADFNLVKAIIQETQNSNNLEINYSGWQTFGLEKFPQNVKIIIKGSKNSQIVLENTKFDFSKMDTPYSVPSNYTKTVIK